MTKEFEKLTQGEAVVLVLNLLRQSYTIWRNCTIESACAKSLTNEKLRKRLKGMTNEEIEQICVLAIRKLASIAKIEEGILSGQLGD